MIPLVLFSMTPSMPKEMVENDIRHAVKQGTVHLRAEDDVHNVHSLQRPDDETRKENTAYQRLV
jgi:hypothetical protein